MNVLGRAIVAFPVSEDDPTVLVGPLDGDDLPSFRKIFHQMQVRSFAFGRVPRFVVLRDEDHAQAWLAWYTRLQFELFKRDLGQSDKRISIAINRSQDWSTVSVGFRLSTAGVGGYTQYRIFIRRISDELFACRE